MLLNNERALKKWLKFEYQNMNKNLVTQQIAIADLLKMDTPKALTRTGEEYRFDAPTLKRFGKTVPQIYHQQLKLPIYFYRDLRVRDSCFITDEIAVKVLKHTNDLDNMYSFQDDRLWLSRPLAHDIVKKYPTMFQFIVY